MSYAEALKETCRVLKEHFTNLTYMQLIDLASEILAAIHFKQE